MNGLDRRDFLKTAGWLVASGGLARLGAQPHPTPPDGTVLASPAHDWVRQVRAVIAEGFVPPFYPELRYDPARAVELVRALGGNALRYPAAAYTAFFPARSGYPVHPELKADLLAQTVELARREGVKVITYVPLNHAFMPVEPDGPRHPDWCMRFADGQPMATAHMGYGSFYEGCLNSPLREVIKRLVDEIAANYAVDAVFFDGPYQGMEHGAVYCHCRYCEAAYRKRFGRPVPVQGPDLDREEAIRYTRWMTDEIVVPFLAEARAIVQRRRDVPVLFNDTALLGHRTWRSKGYQVADGFMFEASRSPEDKLFNLQLGRSTERVTWTYIGSYKEYDGEHLEDRSVLGWYSYPVESEELLLDGFTAVAGQAGLLYWGVNRFFFQPDDPPAYPSGRNVRTVFDYEARNAALLRRVAPRPAVGILVSKQTINWYDGKHFVDRAYENGCRGAYAVLKANGHDGEPFLDWDMSAARLARYPVIYASNAVCLSDAQCRMLTDYVHAGGRLIATHLTSVADEFGRVRPDFGLAGLFGASLLQPEPVEIPDLYLQRPDEPELPQDPQVVRFRATTGKVEAVTFDRGHQQTLGPAIVRRTVGRGEVIYIGSNLEAVYQETAMEPLQRFLGGLLAPWLDDHRRYDIGFQRGLIPHWTDGDDVILFHLLANVGDKNLRPNARSSYDPVTDIAVRLRLPAGRSVRSVRLLRADQSVAWRVRDGWVELMVPSVVAYEAIRVDLA